MSSVNDLNFRRWIFLSGLSAAWLWRLALAFCLVSAARFCAIGAQERAEDPRVQQLYSEAKAAEASGNLATAVAKYKSLLSEVPKLAPAYNNLGALYLRTHEFRKAID